MVCERLFTEPRLLLYPLQGMGFKAFSLPLCTGKCGELLLFLRKSSDKSGCLVHTRSEKCYGKFPATLKLYVLCDQIRSQRRVKVLLGMTGR